MACKIKRIVSVLCLAAAILALTLQPVSGYCETLRFVFLADSRSGTPGPNPTPDDLINEPVLNAIINQINQLSPLPAFVIFGGDMAYRGGYQFTPDETTYLFQTWQNVMAQLKMPVYTVLGNHELYTEGQNGFLLANQTAYQAAFSSNPDNGPPNYDHLVYSFESQGGDAFFAVLDCYYLTQDIPSPDLHGNVDPIQQAWLTSQLAQTAATHKFVFMHPPYYLVTESQDNQNVTLTEMWSILDNSGVNIFFCGHDHLYSRKTINSSILPNPQPSPPTPPFPPWQNNVVQLLSGTCGAPVDTANPTVNAPTLWRFFNTANTYYFSVVDINGSHVKVNSYCGNTGAYTIFDSFPGPFPGIDLMLLSD